jgi:hypothetical protein
LEKLGETSLGKEIIKEKLAVNAKMHLPLDLTPLRFKNWMQALQKSLSARV